MVLTKLPYGLSTKKRLVFLLLTSFLFANVPLVSLRAAKADKPLGEPLPVFITYNAPASLTYNELIEIDGPSDPPAALKEKINALLTTPVISNENYVGGVAPELSRSAQLGEFIRVGFWNIERGLRLSDIKLALADPEEFERAIRADASPDKRREILEQVEVLRSVDILALNEADLGMKRTHYRDVARELAAALKMNYTYGVEFIEIDPLNLGTEEFKDAPGGERRAGLRQMIEVDKERYRGLHGTAILSRFPIKRASLVPLKYQPYDWLREEKKKISIAEAARRQLGKMAFLREVPREIRLGGRAVLIAEMHIPQLPEGGITVVATHFESHCKPSERRRQLQETLSLIKNIPGPVVLAGDLNTLGTSTRPTSIRNEMMRRIRSANFWSRQAIKAFIPFGLAFDFMIEAVSFARTGPDPTSKGVFLLAPNKELGFFKDVERFRFADGFAFDFRGDRSRTVNGTKGTLANSNQRATSKGFISTHATERTYWAVGKSKIDWIFIKAYAKEPRGENEPYRLAPHFARTLEKLNYSMGGRLSDHSPLTVDLPIAEPELQRWESAAGPVNRVSSLNTLE